MRRMRPLLRLRLVTYTEASYLTGERSGGDSVKERGHQRACLSSPNTAAGLKSGGDEEFGESKYGNRKHHDAKVREGKAR
ncbi:hypothetical protein CIB48_g8596 [Xylaria polymorpha]|nr:hypothetical protein CIB48_g8596 [Xylaria polymorpha]